MTDPLREQYEKDCKEVEEQWQKFKAEIWDPLNAMFPVDYDKDP